MIKTGSNRIVFLIGKYAIKIPNIYDDSFYGKTYCFLRGWQSNRREYRWSRWYLKYSDRPWLLNHVRFSIFFSLITVYDRCEMIDDNTFMNINKNRINFGGYEHKADSFGVHKTQGLVIIDYGG